MYTYSTVHPIVLSADDVTGITVRKMTVLCTQQKSLLLVLTAVCVSLQFG